MVSEDKEKGRQKEKNKKGKVLSIIQPNLTIDQPY